MNENINRQIIIELWQRMGRFDFASAGELLHNDYVCEWPQSNERIRGRANFVALNSNYPGRWATEVKRVIVEGDHVSSEVALTWQNRTIMVVSFYAIRDGKILHEIDYWPEAYAAPEWRARWVEHM